MVVPELFAAASSRGLASSLDRRRAGRAVGLAALGAAGLITTGPGMLAALDGATKRARPRAKSKTKRRQLAPPGDAGSRPWAYPAGDSDARAAPKRSLPPGTGRSRCPCLKAAAAWLSTCSQSG